MKDHDGYIVTNSVRPVHILICICSTPAKLILLPWKHEIFKICKFIEMALWHCIHTHKQVFIFALQDLGILHVYMQKRF